MSNKLQFAAVSTADYLYNEQINKEFVGSFKLYNGIYLFLCTWYIIEIIGVRLSANQLWSI